LGIHILIQKEFDCIFEHNLAEMSQTSPLNSNADPPQNTPTDVQNGFDPEDKDPPKQIGLLKGLHIILPHASSDRPLIGHFVGWSGSNVGHKLGLQEWNLQ